MEYIVTESHGNFLTLGGKWTAEYPDAAKFNSVDFAMAAVRKLSYKGPVAVVSTDAYETDGEAEFVGNEQEYK